MQDFKQWEVCSSYLMFYPVGGRGGASDPQNVLGRFGAGGVVGETWGSYCELSSDLTVVGFLKVRRFKFRNPE